MAKMSFSEVADQVIKSAYDSGVIRFNTKNWIHANKCFVSDYVLLGMVFSIDVTPEENGSITVDFVPRTAETIGKYFGVSYSKKFNMVRRGSIKDYDKAISDLFSIIKAEAKLAGIDLGANKWGIPVTSHPKRVGILTLPMISNFGGNLQAFALTEVLKLSGHKPVMINRRWAPKDYKDDPSATYNDILYSNSFELRDGIENAKFVNNNIIPTTRPFYAAADIARNFEKFNFDCLLVGSDQAWRPKYAHGLLSDFFLKFAYESKQKLRRVSYAVSFGADTWEYTPDQTRFTKKWATAFDALSMREDVGVEMCREHYGLQAEHSLDPTLLLPPERYAFLFKNVPKDETKRVVTYVLDPSADKKKVLANISEKLGVPVRSTNGMEYKGGDPLAGGDGVNSVEKWLRSISEAEFVITDSFHGMVFSILFNKQFIAYGNPDRGMARFRSLLKLLGLEDRLVIDAKNIDLEKALKPIDWDSVNAKISAEKAKSLRYLERAVTGVDAPLPPTSNDDTSTQKKTNEVRKEPSVKPTASSKPPASVALVDGATKAIVVPHTNALGLGAPNENPLGVMCVGCGSCSSEPNSGLRMAFNDDGYIFPRLVGDKVNRDVLKVCPFNPHPEAEVRDETAIGKMIFPDAPNATVNAGRFEASYVGYSPKFRETSSSGGLATYYLEKLLKLKIVDEIFVVMSDGVKGYAYDFYSSVDDIKKVSKTRYHPVTMEALFDVIAERPGRVAVTGVGCFIKAIRLKQHYHPEFRSKIAFTIGIICGGLKSRLYTDHLAQAAGIVGEYHAPQYRVKNPTSAANDYMFAADDAQNKEHKVRMNTLGDMWGTGLFKSKACDFCTDVTTELADISLGDAWLQQYAKDGLGHSVAITRSPVADYIMKSGIANGELEVEPIAIERVVASQQGGLNHKVGALTFREGFFKNYSDLPIPATREYMSSKIDPVGAFVQIARDRVRSKSLKYWLESKDFKAFNRRMKSSRRMLHLITQERNKSAAQVNTLSKTFINDPAKYSYDDVPKMQAKAFIRWVMMGVHNGKIDKNVVGGFVKI